MKHMMEGMAKMKGKKHMGFANAVMSVMQKQHLPRERASAIIAAGARGASAAAKRRNPRLKRVKS